MLVRDLPFSECGAQASQLGRIHCEVLPLTPLSTGHVPATQSSWEGPNQDLSDVLKFPSCLEMLGRIYHIPSKVSRLHG